MNLPSSTVALMIGLLLVTSACRTTDTPDPGWTEAVTGMRFVRIPAGEFLMGSPADEAGREEQERPHHVSISGPFLLGQYEVTQDQWVKVMGQNPSWFLGCPTCPVENVSLHDVRRFIARLEALSEARFRLPTEAEWEYACRAGTTGPFSTGSILSTDDANFDGRYPHAGSVRGSYRERTVPAGSFAPNGFGLHDMHGNVWEWIEDEHCPYPEEAAVDPPPARCETELHVIRGGSWYFGADSARCGLRYTHRPQDFGFSIGFRLVAIPDEGR